MADRTKCTVAERVKVRGDWRDPGEQVLLTEDERAMYAHALEGDAKSTATRPPAPGYSTRPMTGATPASQRPLKAAQEEADAPKATRPDRTEPQAPSLPKQQKEAGAQKAATPQNSDEQIPLTEETEGPEGESVAEQTTQNDMSNVPHYSYLEKEGTYTTREAIAAATDEELEGVAYISSERVADIREVIPYAGS